MNFSVYKTLSVLCLSIFLLESVPVSAETVSVSTTDSTSGIQVANMDKAVPPCEDFFQYANGTWLKNTPIPPDYSSWGVLNIINDKNLKLLRKLLEDAAANKDAAVGSVERKLGDFYSSGMDETKVEADDLKPLQDELSRIDSIKDLSQLQAEIARLHSFGVSAFFAFSSGQDFKDSTQMIAQAEQAGLGLPDRDYYTENDDATKKTRDQYLAHLSKMFVLLGEPQQKADASAATVMSIETKLAQASMTKAEMRNPEAVYHKMTVSSFVELTPHFAWPRYLTDIGYPNIQDINVGQPDFFKALDQRLTDVAIDDWKTYLRWHLTNEAAQYLSARFVNEDFDFYGHSLKGSKQLLPRWKRVVNATNATLGQALGEQYVKVAFPPEAKAHALDLVHRLKTQLRKELTTLDWMTPETRKNALAKLDAFGEKIGYPDKWRDYSKLEINRDSYVWNVFRGQQFEFKRQLAKIGKPVDRTEWLMNPQTVNAYYWAEMNEIVFPAGILQPPIYDAKADDATNLGAMGMIIGHEMTHGFDDQGRKFDGSGNMKNWWTAEDLKRFEERVSLIEKQYGGYEVAGGTHFKGKLVEGEAAADLGGLTIAYKTLKQSPDGQSKAKDAHGFTADERFFLSFAQAWATNYRPEMERLMANTNPHPTAHFRVNGTLANMSAFAKTFDCQNNCKMMLPPDKRCELW